MRSVVTKCFIYNVVKMAGTYNGVKTRPPLSYDDIDHFNAEVPGVKEDFYNWIKPRLKFGGFVFDPSTWNWIIQRPSAYQIDLWVQITWLDSDNIGKNNFMHYIKETGIMAYNPIIVKPYS